LNLKIIIQRPRGIFLKFAYIAEKRTPEGTPVIDKIGGPPLQFYDQKLINLTKLFY
jgi:hypothetical protein